MAGGPIDDNEFFREVTLRITSSLDFSEAVVELRAYLAAWLPIDTIRLIYYDEEQGGVTALAGVGPDGEALVLDRADHRFTALSLQAMNRLLQVMRFDPTRVSAVDAVETPYVAELEFLRPMLPEIESARSALVVGLIHRQHEAGGLVIFSRVPQAFNAEHVRLFESVRSPIALAAMNARRFHELSRLRDQLAADNRQMQRELTQAGPVEVIGADGGLAEVMEAVRRVAPTGSAVLLQGETGTGKEVIASAIHQLSARTEGPMVRVHCGGIPPTLLDSELFGHEKGAFTGADRRKPGRFERAAGGTIFLDEIGELSLEAQVRLLRVLQEKEFERVGGTEAIRADVRVIVATHRDLRAMVAEGRFREDLYFRLAVFPIHLPPLRQRRQDIPLLARHFVQRKASEMNRRPAPALGELALERLRRYDWPGNVRELQNVIERALIVSPGRELLLPELSAGRPETPLAALGAGAGLQPLDAVIAAHLGQVLAATHGRVEGPGGAADLLGVNPSTLRARMRKLGVPFGRRVR